MGMLQFIRAFIGAALLRPRSSMIRRAPWKIFFVLMAASVSSGAPSWGDEPAKTGVSPQKLAIQIAGGGNFDVSLTKTTADKKYVYLTDAEIRSALVAANMPETALDKAVSIARSRINALGGNPGESVVKVETATVKMIDSVAAERATTEKAAIKAKAKFDPKPLKSWTEVGRALVLPPGDRNIVVNENKSTHEWEEASFNGWVPVDCLAPPKDSDSTEQQVQVSVGEFEAAKDDGHKEKVTGNYHVWRVKASEYAIDCINKKKPRPCEFTKVKHDDDTFEYVSKDDKCVNVKNIDKGTTIPLIGFAGHYVCLGYDNESASSDPERCVDPEKSPLKILAASVRRAQIKKLNDEASCKAWLADRDRLIAQWEACNTALTNGDLDAAFTLAGPIRRGLEKYAKMSEIEECAGMQAHDIDIDNISRDALNKAVALLAKYAEEWDVQENDKGHTMARLRELVAKVRSRLTNSADRTASHDLDRKLAEVYDKIEKRYLEEALNGTGKDSKALDSRKVSRLLREARSTLDEAKSLPNLTKDDVALIKNEKDFNLPTWEQMIMAAHGQGFSGAKLSSISVSNWKRLSKACPPIVSAMMQGAPQTPQDMALMRANAENFMVKFGANDECRTAAVTQLNLLNVPVAYNAVITQQQLAANQAMVAQYNALRAAQGQNPQLPGVPLQNGIPMPGQAGNPYMLTTPMMSAGLAADAYTPNYAGAISASLAAPAFQNVANPNCAGAARVIVDLNCL